MLTMILTAWASVACLMFLTWLVYLWKRNPGIIDAMWSVAISLVALVYFFSTPMPGVQIFILVLMLIWCLRLAGYLFITRVLPGHVDQRYIALSKSWKMSAALGFLINYQFQGVLALIMATPFLFINQLSHLPYFQLSPMLLVLVGIVGETIADRQLKTFISNKKNAKQVCNIGLWRYSRHPNYFFEWLIWLGFGLQAMFVPLGWLGLISPALLLFIMLKITGPITEKASIKSRGKLYRDYQKRTSMFVPWFSAK